MILLTFQAPRPWSTNQDRNLHWAERHGLISEWKEAVGWAWKEVKNRQDTTEIFQTPNLVVVTIPFKDNRRRDPMNYCGTVVKAVIDGLVEVGVWPDDTPDYVRHLEPSLVRGDTAIVSISPLIIQGPSKSQWEAMEYGHPSPV